MGFFDDRLDFEVCFYVECVATQYDLYGHSAGGQFVHRLVEFYPQAKFRKALAANAGWYTFPSFQIAYPYGLQNSPTNDVKLSRAFSRDFTILLGGKDVDPNDDQMNRSVQAVAQGVHRLVRGQNFFNAAQNEAMVRGFSFAWKLQTVPNAVHSNSQMVSAAADILYP